MDITKSFKYYDPLYDVITLKPREIYRNIGRKGWHEAIDEDQYGYLENYVSKILETYEMSRLNFLMQSGLAFLVFPSSTHTRFAHCLGTYYLGEMAINRCWVECGRKNIIPMKRWIEGKGLKDEFLLSLLLHDIGHFPFSHILENNSTFYDDTRNTLLLNHEKISCDFVRGEGHFADFKDYLSIGRNAINDEKFLYKHFVNIDADPFKGTHAGIISWLIDGDDLNYSTYIPDDRILNNKLYGKKIDKNELKMLKRLTSGLLDLDRMDHYRRDSYFMGVKLAQFNVISLLDDIILTEDGIKLKRDGVSHAIGLLQSKENMTKDVFENHDNLAYEVMLNYCITALLNQLKLDDKEKYERYRRYLMFWTDDELMGVLNNAEDDTIRRIMFRIRNRQPYRLVKKYERSNQNTKDRHSLEKIRRHLLEKFKRKLTDESMLLFRIPKGYGPKNKMKEEWLDLNQLMDEKGHYLGRSSYNREVDYFVLKQNEGIHKFWVYIGSDDQKLAKEIEDEIGKIVEA